MQYHSLNNNMLHCNTNDELMQVVVYGKPITLIKRNGKFVKPDELKAVEGVGSAMKPSHENWLLVRKPLSEKTLAENVLVHGTGGLNIDATRIGTQDNLGRMNNPGANGWKNSSGGPNRATYDDVAASGRWPSNTLFSHTPQCRQTGVKRVRGDGHKVNNPINRQGRGFFGEDKPHVSKGERYNDPDGYEQVDAWECDPSCPVRILGEQSGHSKGVAGTGIHKAGKQGYHGNIRDFQTVNYGDTGTAARYFAQFSPSPDELEVPFYYCSKSSKSERNKGCEDLKAQPSQPLFKLRSDLTPEQVAYVEQELAKIGGTI